MTDDRALDFVLAGHRDNPDCEECHDTGYVADAPDLPGGGVTRCHCQPVMTIRPDGRHEWK